MSTSPDQAQIRFANAHRDQRRARKYYGDVRNSLAFHYRYGGSSITGGYQRHFATTPRRPESEHAYMSLGESMERTRFFFADAAAQAAVREKVRTLGLPADTVVGYSRMLNMALRFIVEEFWSRWARSLAGKPQRRPADGLSGPPTRGPRQLEAAVGCERL